MIAPTRPAPILSAAGVRKAFGGLEVLAGVGLEVGLGERVSLIGSNGAGKTTFFNIITRIERPDAGTVLFEGHNLLNRPAHALVKDGIARSFQHAALFQTLSVEANVRLPLLAGGGIGVINGGFRLPRFQARHRDWASRVDTTIDVLRLGDVRHASVAQLPYAIQKKVEIARALVTRPKLLVLDEPAGGLNRREADELQTLLRRLQREFDLSLLLVEHNMSFVMDLSDYIYVVDHGTPIAEGKPTEVSRNPDVIAAYLGDSHADA